MRSPTTSAWRCSATSNVTEPRRRRAQRQPQQLILRLVRPLQRLIVIVGLAQLARPLQRLRRMVGQHLALLPELAQPQQLILRLVRPLQRLSEAPRGALPITGSRRELAQARAARVSTGSLPKHS